jgi:hypothetical protein
VWSSLACASCCVGLIVADTELSFFSTSGPCDSLSIFGAIAERWERLASDQSDGSQKKGVGCRMQCAPPGSNACLTNPDAANWHKLIGCSLTGYVLGSSGRAVRSKCLHLKESAGRR